MSDLGIEFLLTSEVITEDEYKTIGDSITTELGENKNTNTYFLNISVKRILPVNIYKKIYSLAIKDKDNNFDIYFKGKVKDFTAQDLFDYFKFYLESKKIDTEVFKSILDAKSFSSSNGNISILYYTNAELTSLKSIKTDLIYFLMEACFDFNELHFKLDNNRQNTDLRKKQTTEAIAQAKLRVKKTDFAMNATREANKIDANKINKIETIYINEVDRVFFEGQIFSEPTRIITKNGYIIYRFDVTDFSSAISCTAFINPKEGNYSSKYLKKQTSSLNQAYLDDFHLNDWVRVDGYSKTDKYSNNEVTCSINKIEKLKKAPSQFVYLDEEINKRSEVLMHTKMSAFDGIASVEEIVDKVKQHGWKGIGIADRYNVHNYPTIYNNTKNTDLKILYGVELNVLNKNNLIVKNETDLDLNQATYVIFDIETTGLYNEFDDLIEFAGYKVRDGQIIDKEIFLVKTKQTIKPHLLDKVNITNEMLDNEGINVTEALKRIQNFVKDTVLVAHNGIAFDYRFINKKLVANGFLPLSNSIIDTLQLSRAINEKILHHRLGVVAKLFNIEYNEADAHRAEYDTNVLYQLFNVFIKRLNDLKITNLKQLAAYTSKILFERQFSDNFVITYVKDQKGFKPLYKIVSDSNTKNLFTTPRVFIDDLINEREHFILMNHPTESDLFDNALNGLDTELETCINFYDYILVASDKNIAHLINNQNISVDDARKAIKRIVLTAKKLNKKVIATSDAYYLNPWEEIARRVYVNSKLLGGKNHRFYSYGGNNDVLPNGNLRTTKDLIKEFSFLNDDALIKEIVITNPNELFNSIDCNLKPIKTSLYPPIIDNVEEKIAKYVQDRLKELYGDKIHPIIQSALDKEIDAVFKYKYSIIYWVSHLLVKKSLDDGYLVGSRGSVGSSILAYLLNITEVNPLPPHYICKKCKHIEFVENVDDGFDLKPKQCPNCGEIMFGDGHDIPFETFMGFKGDKIPDIDLNFSGEYQHKAHQFIRDVFGADHVFRSGTISTVADKTAFGYVKNYFESKNPNQIIPTAYINWIVKKCSNVKRTTGQHPGGIIVIPRDMEICDFTPYNYPADEPSDWYTSHFTYDFLHDCLLKFDVLGHDDPTKLKILDKSTNVHPTTISFYDDKVLRLFTDIEVMGIKATDVENEPTGALGLPEFGTDFVRQMLCEAKPRSFADLVRISGLSHGTNVWLQNSRDLILESQLKLSEVISCRDDIMINLIKQYGVPDKVAFNVMESVRKGKGIKTNELEIIKEHKVKDWYINSCQKIAYLFPKAHATAYVINAWRMAWYKIYYPLHFYAAYFSINAQDFDLEAAIWGKEKVLNKLKNLKSQINAKAKVSDVERHKIPVYEVMLEMFARGFKFANVDLKHSLPTYFIVDKDQLIPPFLTIPGLGFKGAFMLHKGREYKPYISKEDLLNRAKVQTPVLKAMEDLGITNGLKEENQMSLFDDC